MNVHDGVFKPDGLAFLDETQAKDLDNVTLAENDVLLNITGASVARACRLPSHFAGGRVNQHVAIIRPRPDKLHADYLSQCLVSPSIKHGLLRIAGAGATREAITKAHIQQFEIPLPPLDEQRRIAAILDQADDLRRKRREAIEEVERLSSALFTEMFFSRHEKHGPDVKPLEDLCSVIRDGTHKTPTYVSGGIPFVTVKNIVRGSLDLSDTKFITMEEHSELTRRVAPTKGDILVSKDGTIGVPCPVLTDETFSIFVSVALLRPKTHLVDQTFLTAQLRTAAVQKQIRERSKGIAIRHLHLEDFRALRIVVPDLGLQKNFAARVAEIDKLKAYHRAHLSKLDALFTSLQHRAFRGKL